jgi:imidazole glycerol-phosphate synthase subunit HisH
VAEVSIVDYGIGNTGSILNMLRKLRVAAELAATPAALAAARRLLLPGIGAFDACVAALQASGLRPGVTDFAASGRPLLGICVGMQMLTQGSEEGVLPGLGLVAAHTRRFAPAAGLRIPHMGWDTLRWRLPQHPLARDLNDDSRFYFVHSYYVSCAAQENSLASCTYGVEFSAAIVRDNVAGVQFHPEKSHRFGLQLLKNFASL